MTQRKPHKQQPPAGDAGEPPGDEVTEVTGTADGARDEAAADEAAAAASDAQAGQGAADDEAAEAGTETETDAGEDEAAETEPDAGEAEAAEAEAAGDDAKTDAGEAGDDAKTAVTEVAAAAPAAPDEAAEARTDVAVADKTAVAPAAAAVVAASAPSRRRRIGGRLHTVLIAILLVLSCLMVVVTGIAWWAHYTTMNTNGYMKIVGPIGKDPAAIKSLSDYVASQVISATDLQARAESVLPSQVQFLAGPITAQVQGFIQKETYKLLSTEKAYQLWLKINEVAHDKIVGLLRGENTYTYIAGSDVKLNVLPLISQALQYLEGKLPGFLTGRLSIPVIDATTPPDQAIQQVSQWAGKPLPADFGQITLLKNDSLGLAQTAIKVFDMLMWVLPLIAAVLIALTIWLSHARRTTIIILAVGVAIALIITHVVVGKATESIVSGLTPGTAQTLTRDVIEASLRPLTTITVWIVVIAAVAAVVAWFLGRHDLRASLAYAGKTTATRADRFAKSDAPAVLWIRKNKALIRVTGLVVLLLLLLALSSTWTLFVVWLIVLALYQVGVSYIVGEWPFPERAPQKAPGDAA